MGDRGNVIVHQDPTDSTPPVWIYAHWHGSELPGMLAVALALPRAQSRLGDAAYLTRIVFCSFMEQTNDLDGETGWGISTSEQDNEHAYIHLEAETGAVCVTQTGARPDIGWMGRQEFIDSQAGSFAATD